jgi:tRNA (guanine37-N1)-methyltransferase
MIDQMLSWGIIGRARSKQLLQIEVYQLRDYTHDRHRTTDDYVYGGGGGMVMKPEPVFEFFDEFRKDHREFHVVFPSPQGTLFDSGKAVELAQKKELLFLCGRYEGIDERIMSIVDEELSIGSFVVSGGEIPSLLMIDAISRFIPGVVGNSRSVIEDSFYEGLLDHANWTRPEVYRDLAVPKVYVNGNHANIDKARKKDALLQTIMKKPELFIKKELDTMEKTALVELIRELSRNVE